MFPSLRWQPRWNIVVGKRSYREAAALFAFQLSINTLSLHAKKFVSQTSQEKKERVPIRQKRVKCVGIHNSDRVVFFKKLLFVHTTWVELSSLSQTKLRSSAEAKIMLFPTPPATTSKQTCDTRHEPIVNANYVKWNRIKRPIILKFSL